MAMAAQLEAQQKLQAEQELLAQDGNGSEV